MNIYSTEFHEHVFMNISSSSGHLTFMHNIRMVYPFMNITGCLCLMNYAYEPHEQPFHEYRIHECHEFRSWIFKWTLFMNITFMNSWTLFIKFQCFQKKLIALICSIPRSQEVFIWTCRKQILGCNFLRNFLQKQVIIHDLCCHHTH